MNEDQSKDPIETSIAAALRQEPESWTPACLPPERIIALAERSVPEAAATRLMAHVALCGRCRREYAETVELLRLSDEVSALEGRREAAAPTVSPAPPPAPEEPAPAAAARPRPFWQSWFKPGLGLALGAAAVGLVVYLTLAAPAQRQRDWLASTLAERQARQARLEQELADLKRQNEGDASRLAGEARRLTERLKAQEVRMARLEQDAAVLREVPLPTPAWLLSHGNGTVRGGGNGGGPSPEISLIEPVDTAVSDTTPTLEFRPVAGVAGYQVTLEMEDSTEEVPTVKPVGPTRWRVTRPLRPGKVYQWAVTAQGTERPLRSPLARFYLLSAADRSEIEKARKEQAQNPLALGALYARLGMMAQSEEQFQAALKADPAQPVARRWLDELAKRNPRH